MPKIVDHDERRKEVVAAAMRVIARLGLEATTVREIAREAGYSSGVLAHYFASKEEILVMAHETAFALAGDRIARRTAGVETIDLLRIALHEALPLDGQRVIEARIDVGFWNYALVDADLRKVRTASYRSARKRWMDRLALLRSNGIVRTAISDELLAMEILMLIDSLSVQALIHPRVMTPAKQKVMVEIFLERIQREG